MQNLPRIFIDSQMEVGKQVPLSKDQLHYLQKVMRTDKCLVFNNGKEFYAEVINSGLSIVSLTEHKDPSNNLIFAFAPIKQARMEEMLNAATQMGVQKLQPVITDRTTERFPKWERIKKIIVEASEQSGRNSVPELLPPIKFSDLNKTDLAFADERFAHDEFPSGAHPTKSTISRGPRVGVARSARVSINITTPHPAGTPLLEGNLNYATLLVGPEGGFSDKEFAELDKSGAIGLSLGKTILRAEVAAVALLAKIL